MSPAEKALQRQIVDIIASTKVAGVGYYQRVADRIMKEAVKPYVDEVKAGYEETMFKRARKLSKRDRDH